MTWRHSVVAVDGTHHVVDGWPLYDCRFGDVLPFREPGLAPVQVDGVAWHIHVDGSPAYDRRFARSFGFYEGLAAVQSVEGWHHIRPDGTDVDAARYTWCGNYQGGRCAVRARGGRYLHVRPDGSPAYAARWRYAGDFRDGLGVVQADDGRSTHVDRDGNPSHGRWFVDLDVFHKGLARARDAIGWMHIDASGTPAYARRFAQVEPFYNGQARVEQGDGRRIVIDERGDTLLELRPVSFDGIPLPVDRPVAILVRHAERPPLPEADSGHDLALTEEGHRAARRLGAALGSRIASIATSPVRRCRETASAIAAGAAVELDPRLDQMLGDPGVFVADADRAWGNWLRLGNATVIEHLALSDDVLPGMAVPREAMLRLLRLLVEPLDRGAGIHIFVTHDVILAPFVTRVLTTDHVMWPDFLAAMAIWRDGTAIRVWFDGRTGAVPSAWAP